MLTMGIAPFANAQDQPKKADSATISLPSAPSVPLLPPSQSLGNQSSMSGVLFTTQPAAVAPEIATPSVPMQGSCDWIFSDMNALFGSSSKSGGSFGSLPSGSFGGGSGLSPV